MIRLLIIFIVFLIAWLLFGVWGSKATLEEARTIGLQEASSHIDNPILLEDYTLAKGIPKEALDFLIEEGKIPFYHWRQYTYIENRELVVVKK
ncbi:hypothetical protein [Moritella yayanosii]|uniref:Uncharacterized protein n=1 Tax=Moritella yayanosii TaxID=69539 RepID=A0A330LNT4_9GAMM|nr:hypothetical protein [Moritella yayanosii]SQD77651.1 conserved exported protein of unknown function [Moritella yayanosii]